MNSQDNVRQADTGRSTYGIVRNNQMMFGGIVIILAGLAMLSDRTGFSGLHVSAHYWPLLLIALGVMRLVHASQCDGRPRSRRMGAWLVYVGCWGLVNEFHIFGFAYHSSWPLLIVGAGIGIVWRALENPEGRSDRVREC